MGSSHNIELLNAYVLHGQKVLAGWEVNGPVVWFREGELEKELSVVPWNQACTKNLITHPIACTNTLPI